MLNTFLSEHACSEDANVTSISGRPFGGKYSIPAEKLKEFFALIATSKKRYRDGLVAQANGRNLKCMVIDLDFLMKEQYEIQTETYIAFMQDLALQIKENARLILCLPEASFYEKKGAFKTGAHLFINFDRYVPQDESMRFRQENMHLIKKHFSDVPLVEFLDHQIWDWRLAARQVGTCLIYGCKARSNGPKSPAVLMSIRDSKLETFEQAETTEFMTDVKERIKVLHALYGDQIAGPRDALWKHYVENPKTGELTPQGAKKPRAKKPRAVQEEEKGLPKSLIRIKNEDGFRGLAFIRWAAKKGWGTTEAIVREDWKSVVSYFAACGFDPVDYGAKLTHLFDPEGRFAQKENEKMMAKIQALFDPALRVQRKSIEMILDRVFPNQWSGKELWQPKQKYLYFDDYRQFVFGTGPHDLAEFEQFLIDTTAYVVQLRRFVWSFKHKTRDKQGNVYISGCVNFSDNAPHTGNENFDVFVKPSVSEYIKVVKSCVPRGKAAEKNPEKVEQCKQILTDLGRAKTSEAAATIVEPLKIELEPQYMESAKIVKRLMRQHRIKRYTKTEFKPYLYDDPTEDIVLNTWRGWPLLNYRPKRKVNVKKTESWILLDTILSNNKPRVREFLFDWLACKAQNPEMKFGGGRIFVIKAVAQGCGKSTFVHFLIAVFGRDNVVFLPNLKALTADFSWHMHSKIFVFIDDIDASTSQQTGNLKARISAPTWWYQEKNKTRVEMTCCEEYVTTSNCKKPLYQGSEDRRQAYIIVNDKYAAKKGKHTKEYFNNLYAEFEDHDKMSAWFRFFMSRDVSKITGHQSEDPPECVEIKTSAAQDCMRLPHRWLAEYFAKDEFIMVGKRAREDKWFDGFQLVRNKQGREIILMLEEHAYMTYNRFIKADYPRTKPGSIQDFRDALEEVGIKAGKKKFSGRRPNKVFAFEAKKAGSGLVDLYGGEVPEGCTQWPTGYEFKYLKACLERGYESTMLDRATFELGNKCVFRDAKKNKEDVEMTN
jgi:hypothetical protein